LSVQEYALYGDLVFYLRDRAAELLAGDDGDAEAERARLDTIICWRRAGGTITVTGCRRSYDGGMMSSQDLFEYVCERVIGRLVEQVPGATEEAERAWFDQMLEDWIRTQMSPDAAGAGDGVEGAEVEYRTPEGKPLHRMTIEFEEAEQEGVEDAANVPDYDPPPLRRSRDPDVVQLWMRAAYEPWPDLPLEQAARVLSRRIGYSVPRPPLTHESVCLGWSHFSEAEAQALAFELHVAGVDVEDLVEQIGAFPYDDISLVWLVEPERCIHLHTTLLEQMGEEERGEYPESLARLRHTIEFIDRMARLIPPHVRTWLSGWSAAFTHAGFARAVGLAPE